MTTLISQKMNLNFLREILLEKKERRVIKIKASIYQENMTITNVYASEKSHNIRIINVFTPIYSSPGEEMRWILQSLYSYGFVL